MDSLLWRALALGALVLVVLAVGVVLKRRDGRVVTDSRGLSLAPSDVGAPLGSVGTFVQFSTSTCTPCRAVRRLLGTEVAGMPGVEHVEVDAEERLDLARRFHVLRTPTVLVLDGDGRVTARFSGVPTPGQVRDAVPHAAYRR